MTKLPGQCAGNMRIPAPPPLRLRAAMSGSSKISRWPWPAVERWGTAPRAAGRQWISADQDTRGLEDRLAELERGFRDRRGVRGGRAVTAVWLTGPPPFRHARDGRLADGLTG